MDRNMKRVRVFAVGVAAALALGISMFAAATTVSGQAPDLNGYWKLDRERSVLPPRADSLGRRNGPRGDRVRMRGARNGRRPGGIAMGPRQRAFVRGVERGPSRLPDLVHVTQTEAVVSIEDSTGNLVQQMTTSGPPDTTLAAPSSGVLSGVWTEGRLVVERPAWRGNRVTETIGLEDAETLVIEIKVETDGSTPAREFKRVYRKVTEW